MKVYFSKQLSVISGQWSVMPRLRNARKLITDHRLLITDYCFLITGAVLLSLATAASATPLDDKIAAYKKADTQAESAVAELLKLGLEENRAAEALAVAKTWLSANPAESEDLQYYAGRAMQYSGDWSDAVIFYRKFLRSERLDAKRAALVVPAAYRLLINDMRDADSAYLLMREDGSRLRQYGTAKQFDAWFLREASRRNDVAAMAERLAAIHENPKENPADYAESMRALYAQLESFTARNDSTVAALDELARVATREPGFKARWDWINAVSRYNAEALKIDIKRQKPDEALLKEPLKAARALIAAEPVSGSAFVVKGWSRWNQGDTPTFFRFVHVHRDLKAQVFIEALEKLPAEQAKGLLSAGAKGPRGRWVSVASFISPAKAASVIPRFPDIFNSLNAPSMDLWHKDMTLANAKALAPYISRNPHASAALVRAYAATGKKTCSDVVPVMAKSESWRFAGDSKISAGRRMVDYVWRAGLDQKGFDHGKNAKLYETQLKEQYAQLSKQVAKDADSKSRMAAFNVLNKELLSNPTTPSALGMWDELFANAPDADKVTMLIKLADGAQGDGDYLLRRASRKCRFGRNGSLFWQADVYDNHFKYHQADTRKSGADFINHLSKLVKDQTQAGTLTESIFGLWLHAVDCRKKEVIEQMKTVVKSSAYAKINPAYHKAAANDKHFGDMAMTDAMTAADPRQMSRELRELPKGAAPAKVEAAFKTVMGRVDKATEPIAVVGLKPLVPAVPKLSAQTRKQILRLFDGASPLGAYPSGQGYGELANGLLTQMHDAKQWGAIVPHASAFWRALDADQNERHNYPNAENLVSFAEEALEAGAPSVAILVARAGMRGKYRSLDPNRTDRGCSERFARLRSVAGKASVAMGVVDIPVDETDSTYGIYKSNAEFIQGNLDSAWKLYLANAEHLFPEERNTDDRPLIRKLSVDYGFWLLRRNTEDGRTKEAEQVVKELMIWSRQESGVLSVEQDGRLKVGYADLALRKGALPTARAWYRKVADAQEYQGSGVYVQAALGSVKVDRVSRNFSAALEELEKLMRINKPEVRAQVRYARAEVMMDQENFKDAFDELEAVLRSNPDHADALILRGKLQYQMRKLVEATEIELGVSREEEVMVPGETLKINLHDPTLSISGVGADIEVEVFAKSGDSERVLLHQLGDNKERFRADVVTALAPPVKGDKILQVLGVDEITYGYSKRFRAKMKDLPADPDIKISIASDAHLAFSAGAFPAREGERKLDMEELGLSSAQQKLGLRSVRPGNPVYIRVTDADQSKTSEIDELPVTLESSSGDSIRRLLLKETGPYTGEFEAIVPTSGAQALAFASESAPGRDPNMSISSKEYPGWLGNVGDKEKARTFGVDLNDNVPVDKMSITFPAAEQKLTHFVLQTSLNGQKWVTRSRFPDDAAPWDGRPQVTSIPTYRGGIPVSKPKDLGLPVDWAEKMELGSVRASCNYLAQAVTGISAKLPIVNTGHPGYSGLLRYRAVFYQASAATRRFQLSGYPTTEGDKTYHTIFLIDGKPANEDTDDPMIIERDLAPGLHEIQVWRHEGRSTLEKRKPVLLCDVDGKDALVPCPDSMFDPKTFPEGVRNGIPTPAKITATETGLDIAFGPRTQARLVRLSVQGFEGVAPAIKAVTLSGRDGKAYLPVGEDFMALRDNKQLEVLPGDQIVVRYADEVTATPKRNRHEQRLQVAFNTATLSASFLNYEMVGEERRLVLEPIRRFNLDDAVAIVVDDVDMDGSPERDVIEFTAVTSEGTKTVLKAVETEEHSGQFIGRIFPVDRKPERQSELQVPEGGTLTLTYRDMENLNPGIPTDRTVTIEHAKYQTPALGAYTASSKLLNIKPAAPKAVKKKAERGKRNTAPETVRARRSLAFDYVGEPELAAASLKAVIGSKLRFDVVVPHLALAQSSEITAYVQTDAGRKMALAQEGAKPLATPFDINVPGTLKLLATPSRGGGGDAPKGYVPGDSNAPGTALSPIDEGRFTFSVPLILGDRPNRSFATKSAERSNSEESDGLIVQAGDVVHIGYAYKDEEEKVHWKTTQAIVGSHAFLDVMNDGYNESLDSVFVGERVFVRVVAPGLDRGPERDWTSVNLKGTSGAAATFELRETEAHSGTFKGVFTIGYADKAIPQELPPVELNGLPVKYGDIVNVTYAATGEDPEQRSSVTINKGADGTIEPFSKRFTGDEMAVKTSFTLAECFFELAKKHRKMDQESLARREMSHAQKLLSEAIATFRDDELRAHAEYLLGNLSQEYADLSKNDNSKLPMYQDALARFSKIPVDYPETEFANKAQFKTGLVYEKMGEGEIAVEEYVKLAYKYPDSEHIPEVMSRLGRYFQKTGQGFKVQADALREKTDETSKAEVLRLDELSFPEFIKAAIIYGKLIARFPDHKLAGYAGLASAQNYMRAHQYETAIDGFMLVVENENYDDREVRSQALYWSGLSYERLAASFTTGNYRGRGNATQEAYETYRRVTFDFPDSKWAKFARGRLSDPVFARIIEIETENREIALEKLQYEKTKRAQDKKQQAISDRLRGGDE
jgi:tetratricopeptide (TPR) repeat protein